MDSTIHIFKWQQNGIEYKIPVRVESIITALPVMSGHNKTTLWLNGHNETIIVAESLEEVTKVMKLACSKPVVSTSKTENLAKDDLPHEETVTTPKPSVQKKPVVKKPIVQPKVITPVIPPKGGTTSSALG